MRRPRLPAMRRCPVTNRCEARPIDVYQTLRHLNETLGKKWLRHHWQWSPYRPAVAEALVGLVERCHRIYQRLGELEEALEHEDWEEAREAVEMAKACVAGIQEAEQYWGAAEDAREALVAQEKALENAETCIQDAKARGAEAQVAMEKVREARRQLDAGWARLEPGWFLDEAAHIQPLTDAVRDREREARKAVKKAGKAFGKAQFALLGRELCGWRLEKLKSSLACPFGRRA